MAEHKIRGITEEILMTRARDTAPGFEWHRMRTGSDTRAVEVHFRGIELTLGVDPEGFFGGWAGGGAVDAGSHEISFETLDEAVENLRVALRQFRDLLKGANFGEG